MEVRGAVEVEQLFRQLALPVTFRAEVCGIVEKRILQRWVPASLDTCTAEFAAAAFILPAMPMYTYAQRPASPHSIYASCLHHMHPPTHPPARPSVPPQDAGNKRPPFRAPFSGMVPDLVRIVRGHVVDSGVCAT